MRFMLYWMTTGLSVLIYCGIQWSTIPIQHRDIDLHHLPFVCDLVVDAGLDTNVCAPGGSVGLIGTIEGSVVYYQWTPPMGLSDPFSLTPIATVTGDITYTLTGYGFDPDNPNLIVNGDFSAGNTGFVSEYSYVADIPGQQNEMNPEGTYTVIHNPNLVHSGFSACSDHTGGGGNMMVVNGAANLQDIWCHTVSIAPNGWYDVSAWVASMNPASPAQLQFSINGTPIGAIVNAVPTPCIWVPFNATWNSGSSTTAEICILNLNTALGGNDFALDDISMVALCRVEDEVTITLYEEEAPAPIIDGSAFLCEGETGIYTASFPPDPPIYSYHWSIPNGATILSGQGTPVITVLWEDAQDGELCLEIETRCDENSSCYEVTVGTYPIFPLISGPTSLCPGETAIFYTPENDPNDQYEWIIPSNFNVIGGDGTNEIEVEWALPGEAEICLEVTNACGTTENCTLLNLWPSYLTLFETVLCEGSTIDINGTTYGNGLFTGVETFTSMHGCDSVVEIDIAEAAVLETFFFYSLCPGDSIYLEGQYQTEEGTYIDNFITPSGCDSIVTTSIVVSPSDTTWILMSSCHPADTGTTIETIYQGNCDSTIITTIALYPTDTTLLHFYSCLPADTGTITQLLSNQYGCDSLIISQTHLLTTDTTNIYLTSCDPSNTGVTNQLYTNTAGCDSLVITTVYFLLSDTTYITAHTCFIVDTGTTSVLLLNTMGCDSLVFTHTLFAGSDTTYLNSSTCFPGDSGLTFTPLSNIFGCDSIISTYTSLLPSDTTYLSETSCEPLDTGVVSQLLQNKFGCDSLVILHISLEPIEWCTIAASTVLQQPLCFGEMGSVTVSATIGLAPFTITWRHSVQSLHGTETINTIPGDATFDLPLAGTYYFDITSANGLSVLDTFSIDHIPDLQVVVTSPTDMFGFQIPCHGDADGSASAELLSPGTPPVLFEWSNGLTTSQINQLSAGVYEVTVTDSHGCTATSSAALSSPPVMQYIIATEDITCFGFQNGQVSISDIQGGLLPWTTSLDGGVPENTFLYSDLQAGIHSIVISDQNGCIIEEQFIIDEPFDWTISLGTDTTVAYGESITFDISLSGQPSGTLMLDWSDGLCEDCLSRTISPTSGYIFSVTATDENGCTDTDEIRITVFVDRNMYVPNVFSPNGDQVNDLFKITSGSGLREIEELTIYDRWGNFVFQVLHVQADDPAYQWDGTVKGKPLNPGVYVYKLTVVYEDNRRETKFGDITLIR